MARALARGWGDPVLCSDPVAGRAEALAAEVGGEALGSNREVAEGADLVVLCHKPPQLEAVAEQVGGTAKAVVSILAGRSLADVEAAYPGVPVVRLMPNIAVEVGRGVICYAPGRDVDEEMGARVVELFERLGRVVPLDEKLIDAATGITGVAPAYLALIVEAWADAAIKHGLTGEQAAPMVLESLAGAVELLRRREGDTLALRRAVMSPAGFTARGLAALERAGLRAAFVEALDAAVDRAVR